MNNDLLLKINDFRHKELIPLQQMCRSYRHLLENPNIKIDNGLIKRILKKIEEGCQKINDILLEIVDKWNNTNSQ